MNIVCVGNKMERNKAKAVKMGIKCTQRKQYERNGVKIILD